MQGSSLFASASDCIKLWNANAEQVTTVRRYNANTTSSGSNFKDVAWNYNNTQLAGVSNRNGLILYGCREGGGNEGLEVKKSREQTSVCFGNRKAELYSGGVTGDVNQWNCETGELTKTLDGCHRSPIRRLIKLNEGGKIASACTDGEIVIWHTESGTAQTKLKTSKARSIRGLEHSKYDRAMLCSTSDDGVVCVWSIDKQTTKHTFAHHDAPAMDLSFSTINSLLLASCGLDKKVIFYDIHGNNCVKTITCPQPVTAICFLSNGMHVCAGTSMGNLFLYDLRLNSDPLHSIKAHSTSVQRLVLQNLEKGKRSSKTQARNSSSQRNDYQTHPTLENKSESNLRASQVQPSKRRSWSKVPDLELPPMDDKSDGDGHLTPAGNIPNQKSQMERSLALQQTPLNRSNVSSKRDTLGSYCEGIFSPVASMNRSMQGDVFEPNSSNSMLQRTNKGNAVQSSTKNSDVNFDSPASRNSDLLKNGPQTPNAGYNEITQRDSVTEIELRSSKPPPPTFSTLNSNAVTDSSSPFGTDSKNVGTSHNFHRAREDTSSDNMVIEYPTAANHPRPAVQSVPLPHAFPQYQLDFLRNTVHELIENHEDNMRDQIRHFHVQLIKMFAELNGRMAQLAEQCSANPLLLQEIERLRAENDRLRKKY